jgi:hypothetical protein
MTVILWWTAFWAWMAEAFRDEEPLTPVVWHWTLDDCDCTLCRQHAEEDADDDRRDAAARAVRRQFMRTRRPGPVPITANRRIEFDALARRSLRREH